jgi:hypothetical protein
MPTPLVLGDNLYVPSDNGVIAAFDARSGEERFRTRIDGAGTFSASVVAADERLYFASEDGDVFVLKAGNSYELLAKNSMGEVCMATPAISDGLLLVRTRGHLVAIAEPGEEAGAPPTFRPPAVPLVVSDPYLSVWSFNDRLTDADTRHWTGKPHTLLSLVRIDGKTHRVLGAQPADVPALEQTGLAVLPTRTIYRFAGGGVR